ncbi:unnamed protein product [Gongylonema pulchrum]|uniref:Uncharacterized protein n=1 Tax=Gongylonema pulchrum TaxID=637853 RepID=A0A3P6STQ1_9BILA|nr:unnamed protein product [Gongylonema pulchrum]
MTVKNCRKSYVSCHKAMWKILNVRVKGSVNWKSKKIWRRKANDKYHFWRYFYIKSTYVNFHIIQMVLFVSSFVFVLPVGVVPLLSIIQLEMRFRGD